MARLRSARVCGSTGKVIHLCCVSARLSDLSTFCKRIDVSRSRDVTETGSGGLHLAAAVHAGCGSGAAARQHNWQKGSVCIQQLSQAALGGLGPVPDGPMDKVFAYEAKDSRFDPRSGSLSMGPFFGFSRRPPIRTQFSSLPPIRTHWIPPPLPIHPQTAPANPNPHMLP